MQMKDVEGYIHNVSPVKTPSSGNRYFDFSIQERVDSTRVVCFNAEKRDTVKEKETAKSPVKILSVSPQKRKFQPDSIEYKMNSKSRVVSTKNVPFPWAEIEDGKKSKQVSINDIIFSGSAGEVVSLNAKVFSKGEIETVYSHPMGKSLTMCNLVLADATGAISATIWEKMPEKVLEGGSYEFKKFKVKFFNKKYLNGSPDSEIVETKVVEVPDEVLPAADDLKPKEKPTTGVTGRVVAVDMTVSLICINCKAKNAVPDEEFFDCVSCKSSLMKEFMKPTVSANVVIIDDGGNNLGRFQCSGAVLNEMFQSVKETENYNMEETDVSKLSRKLISQTLLLVKKACIF